MTRRRVVITGMGTVNPLGHDVQSTWAAMLACRSGISPTELFDAATFPSTFSAQVKGYDFEAQVPDKKKQDKREAGGGSDRLDFDQLFVNGERQFMARYPNYDPAARVYGGTAADAISPERVKGWSNPVGGFVHGLHGRGWGSFNYRITGVDDKGDVKLEGGWQNNRRMGLSGRDRIQHLADRGLPLQRQAIQVEERPWRRGAGICRFLPQGRGPARDLLRAPFQFLHGRSRRSGTPRQESQARGPETLQRRMCNVA